MRLLPITLPTSSTRSPSPQTQLQADRPCRRRNESHETHIVRFSKKILLFLLLASSLTQAVEEDPNPLRHAILFNGTAADVVRLLKAGSDPNAADEQGFTPLFLAAKELRVDLVELLLANGADPTKKKIGGGTALTWARSFAEGEGGLEQGDESKYRRIRGMMINAMEKRAEISTRGDDELHPLPGRFIGFLRKGMEDFPIYDAPSSQAKFLGNREINELQRSDWPNDSLAIVYGRRRGWSQVSVGKQLGWTFDAETVGAAYQSLVEVLKFGDAQGQVMMSGWSEQLSPLPAMATDTMTVGLKPIGLLSLYDVPAPGHPAPSTNPWVVRASPEDTSRELIHSHPSDLSSFRILDGSCPCGVIVLDKRGGWYRIALRETGKVGRAKPVRLGWLKVTADQGVYTSIKDEALKIRAVTKIAGGLSDDHSTWSKVNEGRWIGGELWLKIDRLALNDCPSGGTPARIIDRGWTTAFTSAGQFRPRFPREDCQKQSRE
jgi:hypothetical protein